MRGPELGAHMSISGGVDKAAERGKEATCEVIQIFTKSNMQWTGKALEPEIGQVFRSACTANGISKVFGHTSYLINLGAVDEVTIKRSMTALEDEIRRAEILGLPFLVLHPGGHMGEGEEKGLETIAARLGRVLKATAASEVRIALEITAGQGTQLGYRFEHLATLLDLVEDSDRLGICLDTAHLFAAGYDLRTEAGYEEMIGLLEGQVPPDRLLAWHLNDSKAALGSRVDRHQHLGKGTIGLDAFAMVVNDPRWVHVPMVLETPKGKGLKEDIENLAILRSLIRG